MSETEVTIFIMGAIWGATAFLILDTFRLQHEIDRLKKSLDGSADGSREIGKPEESEPSPDPSVG